MQINQIKQKLSITAVLAHYGIKPAKDSHIRCPFHEDDKPSMKIYADTNTYHCFGCGKTGDVIQFIQDKEGIGKHQAILKAKSMIPAGVAETANQNTTSMKTPEQPDYEALFKKFRQSLLRSTKAQDYLKERGLENFKEVGYNSGKFYNKLKHCIIFPLKDKNGNITSFYGRRITESKGYSAEHGKPACAGASAGKHYYSENRSGLYPGYPPKDTETLIITEAIIDAATLIKITGKDKALPCLNGLNGLNSKTAILSAYGTNGLTREHKDAIKALENLKEVVFFFDGDQPGKEGVKRYSEDLVKTLQCNVSTVETPENEPASRTGWDVNSLFVKYDKDAILQLIAERKPCEVFASHTSQGKPNE
ncbi:MAG: CHC2 zinc finger domain-containing protein, partial [Candidatus Nanoarchaeia archaeon]